MAISRDYLKYQVQISQFKNSYQSFFLTFEDPELIYFF